MMQILRTPDACFENLKDYDFASNYTAIGNGGEGAVPADWTGGIPVGDSYGNIPLRLHHVDEGPRDAAPVLLMHGEPSWSYLYRHMIRGLAERGHRVVAPDLVGFGRSDKLGEQDDYTYERHVNWMSKWLLKNDLKRITFFGQDWGGLIGLRLVAAYPERFDRVVVANTGLPEGTGASEAFEQWVQFSQSTPDMPIGDIINAASQRDLDAEEIAAYYAPFPEVRYKKGALAFPPLVPVTPEHASVSQNKEAWKVLERFEKPLLTAFSDADPVSAGGERVFQQRVPGAKGQPHTTVKGGHFLQEDCPDELVQIIDSFIAST